MLLLGFRNRKEAAHAIIFYYNAEMEAGRKNVKKKPNKTQILSRFLWL